MYDGTHETSALMADDLADTATGNIGNTTASEMGLEGGADCA